MKKLLSIALGVIGVFAVVGVVLACIPTYYKTICHHTPGNNVTLNFQNVQSYNGHLGQPHNDQTYDTDGACESPSPSPSLEPSPEPSEEPSESPTASPSAEPVQEHNPVLVNDTTSAYQCPDGSLTVLPKNAHVYRNGITATVKYVPTGGNEVNFYWRELKATVWQHSLSDQENDGYQTIGGLKKGVGYEFAIEQKNNCGGGTLLVIVDADTPTLFTEQYVLQQ